VICKPNIMLVSLPGEGAHTETASAT
jgi:hypothetical protein